MAVQRDEKLEKLLDAYGQIARKEQVAVRDIDTQIIELQAARQKVTAPFAEKKEKLEEMIKRHMVKHVGQTYVTPVVKASYRASYLRASWNDQELCQLAEDNPRVWKLIKDYRKETEVAASVKLEVEP